MSHPNWIGQTLNGRYKIEELLGQGGMSSVYKGTDPNLSRTVAVKLIHSHLSNNPEFVRRFEQEAAAVAQLRHPNIIQVYDFANDGDVYYMVLEYVPGETLQDQLEALSNSGKRMELAEVTSIMASVGDAVAYAHEKGMIHRDLKPANVMIRPNGESILMDFGVAKMLGGAQHTATGAVIGTAVYMAPEQVRGEIPDERADIYSLGVMLFEIATGKRPYDGDSAISIMMKHINDAVPDVRALRDDVPQGFADVIFKAMAKTREERFQSAAELAAALRGIHSASSPRSSVVEASPSATVVEVPPEATVVETVEPVPSPVPEAAPTSTTQPSMAPVTPEPVIAAVPVPTSESAQVVAASSGDTFAPKPTPTESSGRSRKSLLIAGAIGVIVLLCVVVGGFFVAGQFLGGDETPQATEGALGAAPTDEIVATELVVELTVEPTEPSPPTDLPIEAPTQTPTPILVPDGMALIEAGSLLLGSDTAFANEKPEHPVFLDAFFMNLYEVTNVQYQECVSAGACPSVGGPIGSDQHPVVNVSWERAQTFCGWAGKRLPTEAEWEYAAGGAEGLTWPWGNEFDASLSAASTPATQPVGSFPAGVSPFGIFDMAGNVVEWVADVYVADFYANSPPLNPLSTGTGNERVYRGGSYGNTDGSFYTTTRRFVQSRSFSDSDIGFRCAMDAPIVDQETRDLQVAQFCEAFRRRFRAKCLTHSLPPSRRGRAPGLGWTFLITLWLTNTGATSNCIACRVRPAFASCYRSISNPLVRCRRRWVLSNAGRTTISSAFWKRTKLLRLSVYPTILTNPRILCPPIYKRTDTRSSRSIRSTKRYLARKPILI